MRIYEKVNICCYYFVSAQVMASLTSSMEHTTQGDDLSNSNKNDNYLIIFSNSGRLPYTIGKSVNDYGAKVLYNSNGSPPQISYNEGIFVDYKFFDQNNVEPRFPFGFGLSYTTFQYSGLTVSGSVGGGSAQTGPGSSLDPWSVLPSCLPALY